MIEFMISVFWVILAFNLVKTIAAVNALKFNQK